MIGALRRRLPRRAGGGDQATILAGTAQNVVGLGVFVLATYAANVLITRSFGGGDAGAEVLGVVTLATQLAFIGAAFTRFGMDMAAVRRIAIEVSAERHGRVRGIGLRARAVTAPQVMKGYWNRPDETAKTLTADGWLKTGDMGYMDPNGFVYVTDRKKDMILVSGCKVYPNEIEGVPAMHPGVLESAAVGVQDDKSGEAVKVVVVRKDPGLTEEAVLAFCREHLTGYKVPKHVEFRTELKKSPIGKVLRRELREPLRAEAKAA